MRTNTHLPSPPLVRRPSFVVILLLFLEQMRLALQREADALHAGGYETDDYA
jgi:hypothetical protein